MRVGFFLRHSFHQSILGPIRDLIQTRHECRTFLPRPIGAGAKAFDLAPVRACIDDMIRFRPHVVLSGEDVGSLRLRSFLPQTLFVHTRHGLASKGTTYGAVRAADYACLSSAFVRDWYLEANVAPRREFWIVGYPQMDALFSAAPLPLPFDIGADKKIVLYAPTFQASLSSARLFGDRVVGLLRGERTDVAIVIKPHPLIRELFPEWMETWRRLAQAEPAVYLVEETHADVMPYLKAADVLVTDVSSVALEFLAVNRPMVLVTSPHRFDEPFVDPKGLEWRWRDMGEEVFDVDLMPEAMARALDDPALGAARRIHYRDLLFGDLVDAGTCQRLADHVDALEAVVASDLRLAVGSAAGWVVMAMVRAKEKMMARRSGT